MQKEWIDDFIDAYFAATGTMDFATLQPFSNLQFHPLFAREWCVWLEETIQAMEEEELSASEAHKLITGPSEAGDQLFFTLLDLKSGCLPLARRKSIAVWLNSLILPWRESDSYGTKSNMVHRQSEVDALVSELPFQAGTPDLARVLGRVVNAGYALTDGLYSDMYMGNAFEYRGPYYSKHLKKNQILVVKHFQNLMPLELWPQSRGFPADEITIYCVYENVGFSVDAISCHSVYKGDPIKGLKKWAVKADGDFISKTNHLLDLERKLGIASEEQWARVMGLNFEELKQRGLEWRCYVFKKLRKKLGLDWRPSKKMCDAVKGKAFADEKYWNFPRQAAKRKEYMKNLLDYRNDAHP